MNYAEGLDLYDRASIALPHKDKTLLHHKGKWIRTHGNNPDQARQALQEALAAPQFPYAMKGESDAYIHTSLAANELDALEAGQISTEEAQHRVLTHLQKARSISFLDPHSVHIEAGLMRTLIAKMSGASEGDRAVLLNEALSNVDRTLMLLEHRQGQLAVAQDIKFLAGARDRLLELAPTSGDPQTDALQMWNAHRSQAGFVLASRLLYRAAALTDKGTDFFKANSYASDVIELVKNAGGVVDPQLVEVWLQIHYHWRVLRKQQVGVSGAIDWQGLRDAANFLASSQRPSATYFYLYIRGLALAHLDQWPESAMVFNQIRRMRIPNHVLFAYRDHLILKDGRRAVVQGEITTGGSKQFLKVSSLKTDLLLSRQQSALRPGEIVHAHVRFSFAGPMAVISGTSDSY